MLLKKGILDKPDKAARLKAAHLNNSGTAISLRKAGVFS